MFVLGNPAYYTRFGFALDAAQPFTCVYAGPYFMALRLADTAPRAGIVRYPAVFEGLRYASAYFGGGTIFITNEVGFSVGPNGPGTLFFTAGMLLR